MSKKSVARMLPRLLAVVALLATPFAASGSPSERVSRLDPYLARAAALASGPRTPSATRRARAGLERLDHVVALDLAADPPAAVVRVAGRVPDAALERVGARRVARESATELVRARLRDLPALAALPGVVFVESIGRLERKLDIAVPLVGATALHQQDPAVTGAGVVYGSIDDGIDIRHPTFRNPDGTTRIEAFWDVCDESGNPPPGFEDFGGTLYTSDDIDAALGGEDDRFPHVDFGGHGTLTAAIGAGSGTDGAFEGMAPGAAIVVVAIFGLDAAGSCENQNVGLLGSIDSLLTQAAHFIESTAAARPFVINMSLGDHLGPHDGSTLLDVELESIASAAPGRALVAAAGNEGAGGLHAGVLLPADGTPEEVAFAGGFDDGASLELWYPPDAQIEIRIRQEGACVAPVRTGQEGLGDVYYIDNAHAGADARNGDLVAFVEAWGDLAPEGDVDACTTACDAFSARCDGDPLGAEGACVEDCLQAWDAERVDCVATFQPNRGRGCNGTFRRCLPVRATLELRAVGGQPVRVDAYASGPSTVLDAEGPAMTVGQPASSRGVIAAGAFVHRDAFDGMPAQGELGDLTDYSSQGPMRDGRTKPEIASPAELITTALASGTEPFGVPISDDGLWMTTSGGTSSASPGVAGALALLLEVHPELDLAALHQALALGAVVDGSTGATPNDAWGWGKLQVAQSLATLDGVPGDADGDGFGAADEGGLDCDDGAAAVHPRAAELAGNGLDDDCDGEVDEPLPTVGFAPRVDPICADEMPPDAGTDAGSDLADGGADAGADAALPEADAAAPDAGTPPHRLLGGGGCSCRAAGATRSDGLAATVGLALLAGAVVRRRRAR